MMLVETLNRMPFDDERGLSGLQVCQVALAKKGNTQNSQEKYALTVLLQHLCVPDCFGQS